ncbi:MAG: 50S ribosomal protein L10 [Clostridia bacterium]|nr:50S ribosomal protein L10 [Clostridia bacterium]
MSNSLEIKKQVVSGIKEKLEKAQSVVFYDYRGLTVEQVTKLRTECRKAGVEYVVLKNTMVELAAKELGIEGLDDHLKGPTAVAFGMTDAVAPAKILSNFVKEIKKTEIKCGIMNGSVIDVKAVEALASMPSREVLIARIMGSMMSSVSKFVYCLEAIRKKQAGEE